MKYGELLETMLADSRGKITKSVLAYYSHRLDTGIISIISNEEWEQVSMREAGAFDDAWDDVEEWFCGLGQCGVQYDDIDYKAFKSWKKRFTLKVGWHTDGTWSHPWCFKHKGKKYNIQWPSLNAEVEVTA